MDKKFYVIGPWVGCRDIHHNDTRHNDIWHNDARKAKIDHDPTQDLLVDSPLY
jgi:hypothetical protein